MCLTVLSHSTVVVTLHGEHSEDDGEGVFSVVSTTMDHLAGTRRFSFRFKRDWIIPSPSEAAQLLP
jgi:hypothetical protein